LVSWEHRDGLKVGVGSGFELPDVAVPLRAKTNEGEKGRSGSREISDGKSNEVEMRRRKS